MGIFVGGVMVTREAGSLLPATTITKVVASDCVANVLRLDSGIKNIYKAENGNITITQIDPDPLNLPIIPNEAWSLKTAFYANFNGDLEAGQLSLYGNEIDSIAIRRSSNRDNFSYWEDIKVVENVKNVIDINNEFDFSDKAIESGLWYLYAIQPISGSLRGSLYKTVKKASVYEDSFLIGEGGRQLKLRFDSAISSIKRNIKDTRVETIGSKYPFITRNANMDYKEFPLTGLITHFMDETKEFAPRADLFIDDEFAADGVLDLTNDYEGLYRTYGMNDYNNPILERAFRDKVSEFLHDGKPKLFKTPTEGLIIVRLIDINFTPRQQLGRMIYDFSCTAIEIDEVTIENLEKYGIQER